MYYYTALSVIHNVTWQVHEQYRARMSVAVVDSLNMILYFNHNLVFIDMSWEVRIDFGRTQKQAKLYVSTLSGLEVSCGGY